MRSIRVLGKKVTGWQVLPADAQDVSADVKRSHYCRFEGEPREVKLGFGDNTTSPRFAQGPTTALLQSALTTTSEYPPAPNAQTSIRCNASTDSCPVSWIDPYLAYSGGLYAAQMCSWPAIPSVNT
jgi:hypothetical protein